MIGCFLSNTHVIPSRELLKRMSNPEDGYVRTRENIEAPAKDALVLK